jgi:acyl-CoA thioesterase-1
MKTVTRAQLRLFLFVVVAIGVSFAACNRDSGPEVVQQDPSAAPSANAGSGAARTSGASGAFEIVFLGDSLTAGAGLLSEQAYPSLIEKKFADEGYRNIEIVNAGISGDTTAGGLRRVHDAMSANTRILVVELGGNDALRALTTSQTHDNLVGIIDAALNQNVSVLVAGMKAPPNLGDDYRGLFDAIFPRLLSEYRTRITLMPFILEGVAGNPALNQTDGIHPNVEGTRIVADNMYAKLRTMVDALGGGGD